MAQPQIPKTMRAWQYTTTTGGLENNLKLNESATVPTPKKSEHLVRILASALNPVDYKPAEVALLSRLAIPKPACPGVDIAAEIVKPAEGSSLKAGDRVFGFSAASPFAGGAMAQYAAAPATSLTKLPDGISPADAASVGVVGMTAYQTILPHIKPESKVFLNGGSGGTGVLGIQLAKASGAYVVTSCSTTNVELCKSLGADTVIDYKKESVINALKKLGPFDHVVDNVWSDSNLFWRCHEYTRDSAKYIEVAGTPSLSYLAFTLRAKYLPSFLGGGRRRFEGIFAQAKTDQLDQIAAYMLEGKVKAVIDEQFKFEDVPEAYRKIKTHRTKGKIVVDVAGSKS